MSYTALNIQASVQIFPPDMRCSPDPWCSSPGHSSSDFQAIFRRHHHDCGGDDGGCRGDYGNGDCGNDGCGEDRCDQLTVNGNTVDTGRYTISASKDESGMLTVTDNVTGESFKVWGDPHITTDKGDTTQFQHAPVTFNLPMAPRSRSIPPRTPA